MSILSEDLIGLLEFLPQIPENGSVALGDCMRESLLLVETHRRLGGA